MGISTVYYKAIVLKPIISDWSLHCSLYSNLKSKIGLEFEWSKPYPEMTYFFYLFWNVSKNSNLDRSPVIDMFPDRHYQPWFTSSEVLLQQQSRVCMRWTLSPRQKSICNETLSKGCLNNRYDAETRQLDMFADGNADIGGVCW